ncbi:Gfo/Idh/MocA family protein [Desulfococcus sp.]|uniref:Gfo/Idh/MocA family protein n=1 Tax=Desulfococcus sp. TaxID=2025834 RepID=UPI0035946049
MTDKVGMGIVGCGYWGPNLIRNFSSLPDCSVRFACDADPGRLKHIQGVYPNLGVTTEVQDLLDKPDIHAVTIATPVWTHYDLAKAALAAGKHVLIEKPMASTSAQCRELIDIAAEKALTLMIGHTYIYSAPIRKIKEIVDSGDIGELLYISSQRLNLGLFQKDINVAWDLAPHDISIMLYITGSAPLAVNCQGRSHINKGVEDVTNMSLNFRNGGFATIQTSWLDPNKVRRMTFVGNRRMILFDDNEPNEKIRVYDKRVTVPPHYDTFAEFHYSYHYGDIYSPYVNQVEPLKTECQHFLDCIRMGSLPLTSGLQGLQVVQVLEAASESLKNNGARIEIESI